MQCHNQSARDGRVYGFCDDAQNDDAILNFRANKFATNARHPALVFWIDATWGDRWGNFGEQHFVFLLLKCNPALEKKL